MKKQINNKKTSKSEIIMAVIIIIIILLTTLALVNIIKPITDFGTKKEDELIPTNIGNNKEADKVQQYIMEHVKTFNNYLIDPTKTRETLADYVKMDKRYFLMMVGEDADERKGMQEIYRKQVKEDISEYEKKQEEYAKNLENQIIANYKIELNGIPLYTADQKQAAQFLTVTPYNYALYQRDFMALQEELLKLAGITNIEENTTSMTQLYKARVKVLEILNDQLDSYNSNHSYETNIVYDIGKEIKCNTCDIYLNYAWGEYAPELSYTAEDGFKYDELRDSRVNAIIETAVNSGKLDKENPLKLSQ